MTRAAVMGYGSWGTAFGTVLADAGADVVLWGRDRELADTVTRRHENPRYHPGIELPATLWATTDAAAAMRGADLVVFAVPAQLLRQHLEQWRDHLPTQALLVSLIKGIELGTNKRMSEVVVDVTGVEAERVAVVSGPNLAHEIMQRQPAATVIAAAHQEAAERLQRMAMTPYFRPYTNTDVVGVEVAGAVKNVIALANGVAAAMGFGENTQASLITRGLAEIARLGVAMGADPMTFSGLAGIGDLIATCTSPLSRNRTFGVNLGLGKSVDEVIAATSQTAEAVKSCRPIQLLAREYGVDMPITDLVVGVVHDQLDPREMLAAVMRRQAKPEQG